MDGVELGVVVRRGQTERARYAMQAGVKSLRYFEEYFGIEYPLPKLDMVADALVAYGRENPASAESADRAAANMRERAQLADRAMPAIDAWIARHGRGRGR